jgi:hypothetical protein
MVEIGHKLIEANTFIAHGKWLPWLRGDREAAVPTETPLDIIDDALCRTADAARCWEVNPSIYNDRRLTQLVEQAQDAIAQAYPATDTTLRLLQQMTPDGLQLALIQCEDSGSPLIAISIDADHTLRWRQAAGLAVPPAITDERRRSIRGVLYGWSRHGNWCSRISPGAFSYRDATLRWFLVIFFAMVIGLILALHYGLIPR